MTGESIISFNIAIWIIYYHRKLVNNIQITPISEASIIITVDIDEAKVMPPSSLSHNRDTRDEKGGML